jgi:hypothetical protein
MRAAIDPGIQRTDGRVKGSVVLREVRGASFEVRESRRDGAILFVSVSLGFESRDTVVESADARPQMREIALARPAAAAAGEDRDSECGGRQDEENSRGGHSEKSLGLAGHLGYGSSGIQLDSYRRVSRSYAPWQELAFGNVTWAWGEI